MKGSWLLLAALALVAVLLSLDAPEAESGTFPVQVVGPDGPLVATNVSVQEATAYGVLAAALADAGIGHDVQGAGESLFVTRIGPYENSGQGGWCYDVWDDGWRRPALGAGVYGLRDGQASRWVYEAQGCGPLG